jgi:hypothetical protein
LAFDAEGKRKLNAFVMKKKIKTIRTKVQTKSSSQTEPITFKIVKYLKLEAFES